MSPTLTPGTRRLRDLNRSLTNLDAAQERWAQAVGGLRGCRAVRDQAVQAARAAGMRLTQVADMVGQTRANAAHKYGPAAAVDGSAGKTAASRAAAARRLALAQAAVDAASKRAKAAAFGRVKAVAVCRELDVTWAVIADRVGMAQPNAVSYFTRRLKIEKQVRITAVDPASEDGTAPPAR